MPLNKETKSNLCLPICIYQPLSNEQDAIQGLLF